MTLPQSLLTALDGGAPVPPPPAPIYLDLYLEPVRHRKLAEVYAELAEGESHLRLSFDEEMEARAEAVARSIDVFGQAPAWLPLSAGPSREQAEGVKVTFPPGRCLWHAPGRAEPVDLLAPHDPAMRDLWDTGVDLPDPAQLRAQPIAPADERIAAGHAELPRRAAQRLGERVLPIGSVGTPFWHCYSRLGFMGMMTALRQAPEVMLAACEVGLRESVAVAGVFWEAGLRAIFVEECFSSADLISEEDYLRFAYPSTRELLAALREMGFRTVYYFCGAVESRLQHLAGLPASALAFEESKKGFTVDIGRIRQEIGPQMPLLGNVSAVMLRDGSERQIAADLARQYEAAGPRYIPSIGSPATPDTPPAKIDLFVRAARGLKPA
jgi:hypothetical protein